MLRRSNNDFLCIIGVLILTFAMFLAAGLAKAEPVVLDVRSTLDILKRCSTVGRAFIKIEYEGGEAKYFKLACAVEVLDLNEYLRSNGPYDRINAPQSTTHKY